MNERMMGHLSLQLLGPPVIRQADQPVKFATRKTQALLIYLAIEDGSHTRAKLTALFWPESDEHLGRAALRNTLGYLRAALQQAEAALVIGRDALAFDRQCDHDRDLDPFLTAARAAQAGVPPEPAARSALAAQLRTAVTLYRGDFLDGFTVGDTPDFDAWVGTHREAWRQRLQAIFARLTELEADSGEGGSALETARRWLAHDLTNEAAYRWLMRLYLAAGDRSAALLTYESCRTVLARELAAEPAPETQALAARLRGSASAWPTALPSSSGRLLPMIEAPLVGRAAEHAALVATYHQARRHGLQIVVVEGEAGIGKTRLATAFLDWAMADGADLLRGQAFESGGRLPYQPLVEALRRRLEHENAPDDLLTDFWLAELSRLLPELRERYPDLPPPTPDETTARTRLFEAIARLGQALAARAPLVVFLDDVQWADEASLDVLHYAGRRWADSRAPVLLVLGLRSEARVSHPALVDWLASLGHDLPMRPVLLGPLSAAATHQWVQTLAGTTASDSEGGLAAGSPEPLSAFGRWLFGETSGQPLFVAETLKALLERGALAWRRRPDGGWALDATLAGWGRADLSGVLPPGVRDVIQARLARLTPAALSLLTAGAVLDHDFTFEQVCQVGGVDEDSGLPALDLLLTGHLLRETSVGSSLAGPTRYVFTHDKIRDVVYREAGEARRRVFHRRALASLQGAATPPADLARHALVAGLTEPAIWYSVAAGDEALRLLAIRDAIAHYERAQQVAVDRSVAAGEMVAAAWPVDGPPLHHLYAQLGRAYELATDYGGARAMYEAMLATAQQLGQARVECQALNRLATLTTLEGLDTAAQAALLQRALAVAEANGDTVGLAETEWNLARMSVFQLDPPTAHTHAERALALARTLGLREHEARALNWLAVTKSLLSQFEAGLPDAEAARDHYAALNDRVMEADSLAVIASGLIRVGRPRAALTAAQRAHTMASEIQNTAGQADAAQEVTLAFLECGDYGAALSSAQAAVAATHAAGNSPIVLINLIQLGTVYRWLGDLDQAQQVLDEARRVLETFGFPVFSDLAAAELCVVHALAGDWPAAYAQAHQAQTARHHYPTLFAGFTHWYETEALLRAGEGERAAGEVRQFGALVGSNRRFQIPFRRSLAVLAHWHGESDQALMHLAEAATLAEALDLPGEAWLIDAAVLALHEARGDHVVADEAHGRAARVVAGLARTLPDAGVRARFVAGAARLGIMV